MALALADIDEDVLLKAYNLNTADAFTWEEATPADLNTPALTSSATASAAASASGAPASSAAAAAAAAAAAPTEQADPLGLRPHLGHVRDLDPAIRSNILLSSKQFDPKLFLSSVHPDATFADLSRGVQFLRQSVEQRSEALKVLVEQNFDRFVAVKATTDGVYREMKESDDGPLREEADYGARVLKEQLAAASAKADQVFTPLLENNDKTIKLRSTLAVFERSKFFFNLPGTLSENIEAGRYDVALRDYKKGKDFLESKSGQLFAFNLTAVATAVTASDASTRATMRQKKQQQRIIAKVWDAVEGTMHQMQTRLFAMIQEPRRSVEEQEKTIELLLALNPKDDPVAVFLESQRNHMRSLMKKVYDNATKRMQTYAIQEMLPLDEKDKARNLQATIRVLQSRSSTFDKLHGWEHWKAIHDMVRSLSDVVRQLMPSFWRIATEHASGRLERGNQHANGNSKMTSGIGTQQAERLNTQSRTWAMEILDNYVSLLSKFFSLTDVAILGRHGLSPLPSWVPRDSCSVSAANWMRGILDELNSAVKDICALNVGGGAANVSLRNLLANARFNMTEVLCNLWEHDAAIFHMLEDWTLDTEAPSTTFFLRDLTLFQRNNVREACIIAGGKTDDDKQTSIPAEFTGRIKASFLNGLYTFLDGLVQLAFSEYDPLDPTTATSEKIVADTNVSIDVRELDARILLGVTNIDHLRRTVMPALFKLISDLLHIQMADDLKTVEEVAQQLDGILFDDYVKRKSDIISEILKEGILRSGINWATIPKPSEVHPFIYNALLALVQVHAQVRAVAKPLVNRTITALLEQLAQVTYECFLEVPRLGMGGMLQATLEIEFVHQTLAQYVSAEAEQRLNKVYAMLSSKFQRSSASRGASAAEEAESIRVELEAVKKTLSASRRMTALEYLCFRPAKSRTAKKPVA